MSHIVLLYSQEQVLDPPKESQTPYNQNSFTCPLPPIICLSSSDQSPVIQQEQREEVNSRTIQCQNFDSAEENELEEEKTKNGIQEIPQVERGVEEHKEAQGEILGKKEDEKKAGNNGYEESTIIAAIPELQPSISTEDQKEISSKCDLPIAVTTACPNPDFLHPMERHQPLTRSSNLTKHDKKIIEKIRSYYEAAAKAEEEETQEVNEEGEGMASRRRNSFSQIPSGLVKESVSRFDVGGHLGGPESEQTTSQSTEVNVRGTEPYSSGDSIIFPLPLSASAENTGEADRTISSMDIEEGQISSVSKNMETPKQVDLKPNGPAKEKAAIPNRDGNICIASFGEEWVDKQEANSSVLKTRQEDGPLITGRHPNREGHQEPEESFIKPREHLPPIEQCKKTDTKFPSYWTSNNHRVLAKTKKNLDIPSHIKVGKWSLHSRIVTANRALFEAMGSDIAGIGFFEASPVVDPVLMENSERILSKVQTLAQMYGAKASTMKVPLHQKWGSTAQNLSWSTTRPSGDSPQTQIKSQTQVEFHTKTHTPTEDQQQILLEMKSKQSDTHTEPKVETRTHSETKGQSQTITDPMQQYTESLIQTHYQIQKQTNSHSQSTTPAINRKDHTLQEEKMIKREETNSRLCNG